MDEIDGVRCVPDLASLPGKVDLFVVVLPAAATPGFVAEVIERDLAESLDRDPGRPRGDRGRRAPRGEDARRAGRGPWPGGGRSRDQRRQLPRHPLPAGPLRHPVHPALEAAGRVTARAGRPDHRQRRVRDHPAGPDGPARPALRDHDRQPDGPHGGRLPGAPRRRPGGPRLRRVPGGLRPPGRPAVPRGRRADHGLGPAGDPLPRRADGGRGQRIGEPHGGDRRRRGGDPRAGPRGGRDDRGHARPTSTTSSGRSPCSTAGRPAAAAWAPRATRAPSA